MHLISIHEKSCILSSNILEHLCFGSINIDLNHVTLGQDRVVNQTRIPDEMLLMSFHVLPIKSSSDNGTWHFQPFLAIILDQEIYTLPFNGTRPKDKLLGTPLLSLMPLLSTIIKLDVAQLHFQFVFNLLHKLLYVYMVRFRQDVLQQQNS